MLLYKTCSLVKRSITMNAVLIGLSTQDSILIKFHWGGTWAPSRKKVIFIRCTFLELTKLFSSPQRALSPRLWRILFCSTQRDSSLLSVPEWAVWRIYGGWINFRKTFAQNGFLQVFWKSPLAMNPSIKLTSRPHFLWLLRIIIFFVLLCD